MNGTGILGISGTGVYYIVISPSEDIVVFEPNHEELKHLVSRRVQFTFLESFPPYATGVELYVSPVEGKRLPSNREELRVVYLQGWHNGWADRDNNNAVTPDAWFNKNY